MRLPLLVQQLSWGACQHKRTESWSSVQILMCFKPYVTNMPGRTTSLPSLSWHLWKLFHAMPYTCWCVCVCACERAWVFEAICGHSFAHEPQKVHYGPEGAAGA